MSPDLLWRTAPAAACWDPHGPNGHKPEPLKPWTTPSKSSWMSRQKQIQPVGSEWVGWRPGTTSPLATLHQSSVGGALENREEQMKEDAWVKWEGGHATGHWKMNIKRSDFDLHSGLSNDDNRLVQIQPSNLLWRRCKAMWFCSSFTDPVPELQSSFSAGLTKQAIHRMRKTCAMLVINIAIWLAIQEQKPKQKTNN